MKTKWNEMKSIDKVLLMIRIIMSIVVVILGALQITGKVEGAINYAVPLLGVYLIILSIQEWKNSRVQAILSICIAIFIFVVTGVVWSSKGNVSNVNRVVGYSALYGEELINDAFDVVEKEFAKEFEGCTLTEIRYDEDVENRFADEIARYATEKDKELIVLLSTFNTDEKGGDGGFNPNDTYTNWQWYLVRTADKNSWEIISWGY